MLRKYYSVPALASFFLTLGSGCYFATGTGTVDNSVGIPTLTSLNISEDQLTANGNYLHKVNQVKLTGHGISVNFNLKTQTLSSLTATAGSALAVAAGGLYNLILSNANGDTTFPITVTATPPDPYFSNQSFHYSSINNSGIGTANPVERLDVEGDIRIGGQASTKFGITTPQGMLSLYNYNYGIAKFTGSLGTRMFSETGTDMQFGFIYPSTPWPASGGGLPFETTEANFQPKMSISSVGFVGIGTTIPLGQLDIRHPNVTVNNTTGANTVGIYTNNSFATDLGGSLMLGGLASTSTVPVPFVGISGRKENGNSADYAGYLQFATNSTLGTLSEKMRITSAGNVGIGTSSPSSLLHVYKINSSDYSSIQTILNPNSTPSTAVSTLRLGWYEDTWDIIGYRGGSTLFGALAFSQSGSEKMRINSNGFVGIGTTSPQVPLHVHSVVSYNVGSYGYLNSFTPTGTSSSTDAHVSILADGRIVASEFNANSDRRLKEEIEGITEDQALKFLDESHPVHFKWKNKKEGHNFGFIAQDLSKAGFNDAIVLTPDARIKRTVDDDGFVSPEGFRLSVNYNQLTALLTKGLQILKAKFQQTSLGLERANSEITLLKRDNSALKKQIAEIKEQNNDLKTRLDKIEATSRNVFQ